MFCLEKLNVDYNVNMGFFVSHIKFKRDAVFLL
jgi:hypothetical protein